MEAMIGVESGWNPNAISAKGAMGLPQFVKRTGNAYGLYGKDFYDPDKSTDAMVRYLIDNSNRYGGDIAKMLAQYNGGNVAVGKDNTLRLKSETVDYLLKLMAQIPAMREQRPMLEGKLRNAQQVLASNPGGRALIQLEVLQKQVRIFRLNWLGCNKYRGKPCHLITLDKLSNWRLKYRPFF